MSTTPWQVLERRAGSVIEKTVLEFPPEILVEAQKIPVLFQKVCDWDPEILGTYGHFEAGEVSPANGPIILYLTTIDQYCREEGEDFAAEVRLTYLHELGHHLGWDEGDLEARGLG
jgi:predicted Zn-dependent protease with MMP-like domain